jgi:hypothetical protein
MRIPAVVLEEFGEPLTVHRGFVLMGPRTGPAA